MRFIPTFCLKEGMLLAKNLYNENGNLLLKKCLNIKKEYIEKIVDLGVQGIYIEDDISRDIKIENAISDELRLKSVQGIKNMFINIEKNKDNSKSDINQVGALVENIVDDLLDNKNLMVNVIDIKLFDDYTFFHSVHKYLWDEIILPLYFLDFQLSREILRNLYQEQILYVF